MKPRTKKRKEIEEKRRLEEKIKRIANAEIEYKKQKGKFFGLKISDGIIDIVMLDSVSDVAKEGEILKHCVYSNSYYEKEHSLLLSARKGDERIETVEVSLRKFEVAQCRGFQNKNTEFHDQIINLVNQNMRLIKKLSRKKEMYWLYGCAGRSLSWPPTTIYQQ